MDQHVANLSRGAPLPLAASPREKIRTLAEVAQFAAQLRDAGRRIGGELPDSAVDLFQHDFNRDRVGRFSNAFGGVATGGPGREPKQLPGRCQLAHHQDE